MEMEWVRGPFVGSGSFGMVNLAIPINNSSQFPQMVVKSSEIYSSESLRSEKDALSYFSDCPEIIRLIGDQISSENGKQFYNLFLEYAGKGSLADQLRISGGKFKDSEVKRYTKSILKGLCQIHDKGFAHCDIKLQNILLFDDGSVKIADFGLAKRVSEQKKRTQLRGTPLYMSPELIISGQAESPADIWALGCAVVEMVSGKPAWDFSPDCDVAAIIYRIGMGKDSPFIPESLCDEGKDFLGKCFERDPIKRWTAQMLLGHKFLSGLDGSDRKSSVSPRGPFDYLDCESMDQNSSPSSPLATELMGPLASELESRRKIESHGSGCRSSISGRLGELVTDAMPDWSDSDGWVNIR